MQHTLARKRIFGRYSLAATMIIAVAAGIRILLAAFNWPLTNSDEGTMAIMASNIAYHGEHPYIYYGQDYMGVLEAYLGAGFYHLLGGPSLFALRLGVILLVTLFLVSTYLISNLLFSRSNSLVSLAFLSVGSIYVLTRQMIATGGSTQTLLFGSLSFLLATWLASSYERSAPLSHKLKRLIGYGAFGLVIGLGMWSDMIVLPYLAMASLLLLVFCWLELLVWGGWLAVLLGVSGGLLPSLLYDRTHGLNPLHVLLGLARGSNTTSPTTLNGILHNIKNTTQVSIPTSTGLPFCPVNELRFLGANAPHTLQCTVAHAIWGWGYVLLVVVALVYALLRLGRLQLRDKAALERGAYRHALVIRVAHVILVGAAVLNLAVYTVSSGPVDQPSFHARYLVGLLIATPALVAPFWSLASRLHPEGRIACFKVYACRVVLLLTWLILLIGMTLAFSEVPHAMAVNQQRLTVIQQLEQIGVKHLYTDYWTCNNIIFASHEGVICGVIDKNLQPTHNRAPRYYDIVRADPSASWMCPINQQKEVPANYDCLPALVRMVKQAGPGTYHRYVLPGYVLYQLGR